MKILLIHNFYKTYGGEDTYVENIQNLFQENHKTSSLQIKTYFKYSKNTPNSIRNTILIALRLFYNPQQEIEVNKIIKEFQPDVAYVQNIFPLIGPTIYKLLYINKIPIIQRVSNYRFICPKGTLFRDKNCTLCINKSFKYPSIFYSCYSNSRLASFVISCVHFWFFKFQHTFTYISVFIFPSLFVKDILSKTMNIADNKQTVVESFAKPQILRNKLINLKSKKASHFLYVGRISLEKGVVDLVNRFTKLRNEKLILVGEGPLRKKLENRIKSYENIRLIGFKTPAEVRELILYAKAVIIPSIWADPLPNVLIEAYSLSTPVIARSQPTYDKYIPKEYTFQNNSELKKIVKKMKLINIEEYRSLSERIKTIYVKNFTPEAHLKKTINVFKGIIKNQENS